MRHLSAAMVLVGILGSLAPAGDWPNFRGPRHDNTSDETGLPLRWSPERNIRWKIPLPGPGNSSPIVVDGHVLLTCAEDQGRKRHLLCCDRTDGSLQWKQTVNFEADDETHKTNPYCGSSPVSDGKLVVVWHGSAGMHCYDLGGNLLWSRDLGRFDHIWGYGSSPIIYDDLVIQLCGPGERTKLVALDLKTGETVWEKPEPGGSDSSKGRYVGTWSTPLIVNVNGNDQLLCSMHTRVIACNPRTGEELWHVDGVSSDRGDLVYTSPMISGNIAVVLAGFGGPAMAFRMGGSGDVTETNRLWHDGKERHPQRIGTGVIVDGNLFMANADNPGSIECIDIETGKSRWKVRRTSDGPHWGSMVFADGRLYVTGQSGITRVLAPNPDEFETLAENDLGEQSNSTPAISDGQIFLRTWEHLYCVRGEG